jgi:hypothetical protein
MPGFRASPPEHSNAQKHTGVTLHRQTLVFIIATSRAVGGGMAESAGQPGEFASAFDAAFAGLQVAVEAACAAQPEWQEGVVAGVRAALEWAAADPGAAQLLTNEALAGGAPGFARYDRMVSYIAGLLLPGRELAAHGERLPEVTERAVASGLAMLVAQRLSLGREAELPGLAPEAAQFALTPYLGTAGARRVAAGS